MDHRIKKIVINVLRRFSVKWGAKSKAFKAAFVKKDGRRHLHRCACCNNLFPRKECEADHVDPVMPLYENAYTVTLETYATRLLVGVDGYQILCIPCHETKTTIENDLRIQYSEGKLTKTQLNAKMKREMKKLFKNSESKNVKKTKRKAKTKKSRITHRTRTRRSRSRKSSSSTS